VVLERIYVHFGSAKRILYQGGCLWCGEALSEVPTKPMHVVVTDLRTAPASAAMRV
jgi:hypothetical protein